jgi:hypothetical protein
MKLRQPHPTLILIPTILVSMACGSFAPPASCGENIGGVADDTAFSQYFSSIKLVNEDTGIAGPADSESEASFTQGEKLAISYSAVAEGSLRACVQERAGGGGIPLDQTFSFAQGEGRLSLGTFEAGTYVVRVIIGETLVRNLTFTVK